MDNPNKLFSCVEPGRGLIGRGDDLRFAEVYTADWLDVRKVVDRWNAFEEGGPLATIPNPAGIPGAVEVLSAIYSGELGGERARAKASQALRDLGIQP